jgi:hypothetical protein
MRHDRLPTRLLGIATLGNPISALGLLAALALYPFILTAGEPPEYPKDQLLYFGLGALVILVWGLATLASLATTTIIYAFHIVRNGGLSKGAKVMWFLLNVTVGLFVMPVYWRRHVSRRAAAGEPATG